MRKSDLQRHQAAFQAAKATSHPDHIARIDALTRNARSTWFGLLAALVFVGVTLAGVEHIDFYGVNRATQLPLVNVSVPTRLFFLAAPVLTAAIYIYFHLYLIRLFDALGAAPARVGKEPLSQVIAPWLINDAVLWVRRRNRKDGSHPERRLEHLSAMFNILLAWVFGLGILGWSWYAALPARDYFMNGVGALSFCLAFSFAVASYVTLRETALELSDDRTQGLRRAGSALTVLAVLALVIMSLAFAHPTSPWLSRIDLTGEEIVDKPDGWLPYQIARRDFLDVWLRREGLTKGEFSEENQASFDEEWTQRRALALSELERPDFDGKGRTLLLKDAKLSRAFLSGLNLSLAEMDGVDLSLAHIEGVDLSGAQLNTAYFISAQLEGATFRSARLADADFFAAKMDGANFNGARMTGANLNEANLRHASFVDAVLEGANFYIADLQEANFNRARMAGANLRWARLERTEFGSAQMQEVDLSWSFLTGQQHSSNTMQGTNLSGASNEGGAMRFVDLSRIIFDSTTDFRNAFMDGSVVTSLDFEAQLGDQCQNSRDTVFEDAEFYGRWRGWVEHPSNPYNTPWSLLAPTGFTDVTPIPPPPGCVWKTGPMPE